MSESNGRVVLITGASSGIGQACATHLHNRGYRVYGTSRRAQPPGAQASTERAGATAEPAPGFAMIPMDVNSDASVGRGVDFVLQKEGRLDVVVNNAGFGIVGAIEDTSLEEAKSQFETSFFGVLRVCRAVLPSMRERRSGLIVNISSLGGRLGVPFQGLYSAAKSAVEGMSEALRMEVRPFGIRVVLIEPGGIRTQFASHRRRTARSLSNPAYLERCNKAIEVFEAGEREGVSPDRVAHLLRRVIETRSPRLRYTVGPAGQRVGAMLKQVLPWKVYEWAGRKLYPWV